MATSETELRAPLALAVSIDDEKLTVDLDDGRTIAVPLAWYPRLVHASPAERTNFRLVGRGAGIHWPEVEEDISVDGLLRGKRCAESAASLAGWLATR